MSLELTKLTSLIVACSMKVYNVLGSGFRKEVYKKYFALELEEKGITFMKDLELPLYDEEGKSNYKIDFLVEEAVLAELVVYKNLSLSPALDIQKLIVNADMEAGLLLNYGKSRFSFQRFHNSQIRLHSLM